MNKNVQETLFRESKSANKNKVSMQLRSKTGVLERETKASASAERRKTITMKDIKITLAAVKTVLMDTNQNLKKVEEACKVAQRDGSRIIFMPENALTGNGGHPKMIENGEPVPEGPLSQTVLEMSKKYQLCICTGLVEHVNQIAYNSYIVADKGKFLGVQRKINLSSDEWRYFAAGERMEVFDIGDIRFGITICFDNHFPELAMIHNLHNVDLILAGHAARTGIWPDPLTPEFCRDKIEREQDKYEKMYRGRAYFYNIYILVTNAVGSSAEGLEGIASNRAGTVMGIDPNGDVFLRTSATDKFIEEIVTVELKASKRKFNHNPTRNRNYVRVKSMLNKAFEEMGY